MLMRKLGPTDLDVAALCLGGNVFGWTCDERASFEVLDAYVEGGGNFIDTADVYAGSKSEEILGRWMAARKNRDRIVLATKVGMRTNDGQQGLSRQHILHQVQASLRRLQTDYIDLYQAHRDDQETPLDESLATFDDLVKQGKVRYLGASNYSAPRLAEARQVSKRQGYASYICLQPPYNLVNREAYERELEPLCREQGLAVITYSSLASGFLSGKYRADQPLPASPRSARVQQNYMNERGFTILEQVEQVARNLGATIAQVALAWILARPGITAPIASATSAQQTHELLQATAVKLDQASLQALDQASARR